MGGLSATCRAIPALLRLSRHCRPPQVHVQVDPPSSESRARPGDRHPLLYPSPSARASSSSEGPAPAPLSFPFSSRVILVRGIVTCSSILQLIRHCSASPRRGNAEAKKKETF